MSNEINLLKIAEWWLFANEYHNNQYVIQGSNTPSGDNREEVSLAEVLAQFVEENFNITDMKVTIEFNLPEQQEEYEDFMNGAKWKYIVRELDEHMRGKIKYNGGNMSLTQLDTVQEVRDMLVGCMEQENLRLHA
jgi:hypothetical protein